MSFEHYLLASAAIMCVAAFLFFLGFAFRGMIRRDLNLGRSEAIAVANRLEDAARGGEGELTSEASKIISELRARL